MSETLDYCFKISSLKSLLNQRFQMYHHQARIFRKLNNNKDLDMSKLFDKYGEVIMDWYPIDARGEFLSLSDRESAKFSMYTGLIY